MKRRSTFTTTVLAFLSLTTVPWRIRFGMVLTLGLGSAALLGENGLNARDIAAQDADTAGILHLAIGALKAQVELLFLEVGELAAQLIRALGAEVLSLGRSLAGGRLLGLFRSGFLGGFLGHISLPYSPVRVTNLVAMESFAWPRRMASLAVARSTPSISNRMRPGLTLATQNSGAPLPEPMRTSAGFLDTGTSGKMRIQTRPARFMWRVMARRAASISRALRRSGSIALRPKAPKFSEVPDLAGPWMRPLCCLRNFVRLGDSMMVSLTQPRPERVRAADGWRLQQPRPDASRWHRDHVP